MEVTVLDYKDLTKEELVMLCQQKDMAIRECLLQTEKNNCKLFGKGDIPVFDSLSEQKVSQTA
jgi:hypothetical protein